MARSNRTWLEERGLTNLSAFVNGLISDRIKQEEALADGKAALSRVERLEARLSDATDDATDAATRYVADHVTTNRIAAMLLARLQNDITDVNPTIAAGLTDLLAGFVVNETPEPQPSTTQCQAMVGAPTKGRRQCKRDWVESIVRPDGVMMRCCAQHAAMYAKREA